MTPFTPQGSCTATDVFRASFRAARPCPLFLNRIAAGFPHPADDHVEGKLDLNEHLIPRAAATFFVRVEGDSMVDAGIHSGDLLIVDRSAEPRDGSIVIAVLHDELTVKRLRRHGGRTYLVPENHAHNPIEVDASCELTIWGVVQHVVHTVH